MIECRWIDQVMCKKVYLFYLNDLKYELNSIVVFVTEIFFFQLSRRPHASDGHCAGNGTALKCDQRPGAPSNMGTIS